MDTTTTLDRIAAGWFVHPGSVVLDIGANRGESAAVYLDHGAARVIAFEPRDAAREAMAASLVTDERFTVLPYAMCQRNGTVVIRAPRRNPAAASISRAFFE